MSQLTVFEEVALGLQNLGVEKTTIEKNITESLKLVGLEGFEERSPFEISGGQQQRLAMASALAMKPEILILDEPTNDLDTDTLDLVESMLSEYNGTLIIVSHNRDFLDKLVNKILYF